jgi:hypothetical protein|tara:strand:- start:1387 stop:1833 length:447 start_codon:yes stop_codon:yes gene_type:complete
MATQIVITRGDQFVLDDEQIIPWADKGNQWQDEWVPNTIHAVVWNNQPGQNEIQTVNPTTFMMTGNSDLSSTSDAVGSTTVQGLLDWATTRWSQIMSAQLDYENAYENAQTSWVNDGKDVNDFHSQNSDTSSYWDWSKSWKDYDENYS